MPPRLPSPPRDGTLTAPLPTQAALTAALPSIAASAPDAQLAWARDVLFLVERTPSLTSSPLTQAAVPLILALATSGVPEALYYRATFAAAGTYPALLPANPRAAFRDFEAAARAGWAPAWFRLARDYEVFNDTAHALDCLNRGAKARDAAALHRLGTAYLLQQLGVQEDVGRALGLLHQAACRASLLCPQPAYVFGLILLGEFGASGPSSTPLPIPPALLLPLVPAGQTRESYARAMLERAAALHFAPAQYKLGHAFEFAVPASCALEMARDGDGESRKVAMPMAIRIPDGGGGDDDAGVSSHSKVRWAVRRGVISLRARQRVVIWVLARRLRLFFLWLVRKIYVVFGRAPFAFPFDPLLSVQWYSLASQAGEAEADMALSKWFLCGAEGAFDKDESLARTFAAKAAAKGLPSGEFAMGYYCEVGIGGGKDLADARGWYGKAAAHGNTDAAERLRVLALATGHHFKLPFLAADGARRARKERIDKRARNIEIYFSHIALQMCPMNGIYTASVQHIWLRFAHDHSTIPSNSPFKSHWVTSKASNYYRSALYLRPKFDFNDSNLTLAASNCSTWIDSSFDHRPSQFGANSRQFQLTSSIHISSFEIFTNHDFSSTFTVYAVSRTFWLELPASALKLLHRQRPQFSRLLKITRLASLIQGSGKLSSNY
ncbi:hypothetical protein B0H16DRAFT_1451906 [Mycena metata]|uniref:HCP-like protein n=1 Tax=Mycena metata TaxID=1033252 RepID=A0AAD7NQ37_9AGAR|nr:hypothetical protein B0H16DRAFT_1451906 [Mycena metata]